MHGKEKEDSAPPSAAIGQKELQKIVELNNKVLSLEE
jgi:hypothetical protein